MICVARSSLLALESSEWLCSLLSSELVLVGTIKERDPAKTVLLVELSSLLVELVLDVDASEILESKTQNLV